MRSLIGYTHPFKKGGPCNPVEQHKRDGERSSEQTPHISPPTGTAPQVSRVPPIKPKRKKK